MKLVLESYLLSVSDKILQSYNLGKNLSERFCVYAFLIFSFPHTGSFVKRQVSVLRPGFIMED